MKKITISLMIVLVLFFAYDKLIYSYVYSFGDYSFSDIEIRYVHSNVATDLGIEKVDIAATDDQKQALVDALFNKHYKKVRTSSTGIRNFDKRTYSLMLAMRDENNWYRDFHINISDQPNQTMEISANDNDKPDGCFDVLEGTEVLYKEIHSILNGNILLRGL